MIAPFDLVLVGATLAGLALGAYGIHRLRAASADAARGRLIAVDLSGARSELLRSDGWGISGRPDEIRQLPDGRWIPVEWKTRSAPARGPLPSHRIQLLAYCLLCEARTGRPPPYGVLRYGDGTEFRVDWNDEARRELWRVRQAMARPYDGRHDASPAKCAGCRWRSVCDVRAA